MKKPLSLAILTTVGIGLLAGSANAHEAGSVLVRAGATTVRPNIDSQSLALNGSVLSLSGGSSALDVKNETQLGLTVQYSLTSNIAIEVLAATPFTHLATGTGEVAGLPVAEVKQLPPTVSALYYFHNPSAAFQPYVGAGLNYTVFFEEDVTPQAATTFASLGLSGGDVDLDESFGLALQAGFDYELKNNWIVNASVRWIDLDTNATINFAGNNRLSADVELDPWVYTVAIGYKF